MYLGVADILINMRVLKDLLDAPIPVSDHEKRAAIESALANLIASIDWFELTNNLHVNPQQVEAEFDKLESGWPDLNVH